MGRRPSSTNSFNSARRAQMHKHPQTPRMLRWRPAAAALAAAVAASAFLAVPSAQANEPADPPAAQQLPAPTPGFPLPTDTHPAGARSGVGLHLEVDPRGRQADHGAERLHCDPGRELHEPGRHHAGNPRGFPRHERRRVGLGHLVPDGRERQPDQLQGLGRHLLPRGRPQRRLRLRPAPLERPHRLLLPQDQRRSGQGQVELRRPRLRWTAPPSATPNGPVPPA